MHTQTSTASPLVTGAGLLSIPSITVKPLLSWCGNKYRTNIVKIIAQEYVLHSALHSEAYYCAPFGGALGDLHYLLPNKAMVGEINREIINLYQWVKDGYHDFSETIWNDFNNTRIYPRVRSRFNALNSLTTAFIDELEITKSMVVDVYKSHEMSSVVKALGDEIGSWDEVVFDAAITAERNGDNDHIEVSVIINFMDLLIAQASVDLIWLNRSCFNAIYRKNSSGGFNTPIGKTAGKSPNDPGTVDASELKIYSDIYSRWEFATVSYQNFATEFTEVTGAEFTGQFVYADPLYVKGGKIYSQTEIDYEELADTLVAWWKAGNTVCTSNHWTKEMVAIFESRGFSVTETHFRQSVSSKPNTRGKTAEMFAILRAV